MYSQARESLNAYSKSFMPECLNKSNGFFSTQRGYMPMYKIELIDEETNKTVLMVSVSDSIGDLTEIGEFVSTCEIFAGRVFGDGVNLFRQCVAEGAKEEKQT